MVRERKLYWITPSGCSLGFMDFPSTHQGQSQVDKTTLQWGLLICHTILNAVFWSFWAQFPDLWQKVNISPSGFWETINKLITKHFAKIPRHTQVLNNKGCFVTSECLESWSDRMRAMLIFELMLGSDFVFFSLGVVLWGGLYFTGVSDLGLAVQCGRHFNEPRKGSNE